MPNTPKPTDRPDVEGIKVRLDLATAGPWRMDPNDPADLGTRYIVGANGATIVRADDPTNRRFIEEARQDIPALIAHIEALEDTLRRFDVPLHGDQGDPLISVVFMYDRDSASIVLGPELIATVKGILMNADPALAALGDGDG